MFGKIQKEIMHIHARVMRDVTESPKKWFQILNFYFSLIILILAKVTNPVSNNLHETTL